MVNINQIFGKDLEILRHHRKKDFVKISEGKLIAIWTGLNNKNDMAMLEEMERHFRGEDFYHAKGEKCPYCKGYTKIEMGRKLPDVPFCVTTRMTDAPGVKSKPYRIYEIWIEQAVDPLMQ